MFSLTGSGDGCLGWDSEASSSVARVEGSRIVVVMAASRERCGFSLSLKSGAAFFSGALDGGASIFFGSGLVSPFTSFSMAPAREFSSWGFEGMPGGGWGSAAVP